MKPFLARSEQADTRAPFNTVEWLLLILALVATGICAARPLLHVSGYHRFPLDSYYYFEMARNLVEHGTMSVRFEQGLPNKFFPGYPLLLAIPGLAVAPHLSWPWVHAVLAGVIACLLYLGSRSWNVTRVASLVAVTLLTANPVLNKWLAAPVAEPAAGAWLLGAMLVAARVRSGAGWIWAAITGLCLGMAAVTRPDAAYFIAAVPALLLLRTIKPSIKHLAFLVVCALTPLVTFLVVRHLTGGRLTYAAELQEQRESIRPLNHFVAHLIRLVRDPRALHPFTWVNGALVAIQVFAWAVLAGCLTFLFGRKPAAIAWVALGYLVAHAFWYYISERFNLLILPAVSLAVAMALEVLFRGRNATAVAGWRSYALVSCLVLLVIPLEIYAGPLIKFHQAQLAPEGGQTHRLAEYATPPGAVWSEAGPDFAYYCRVKVYFEPDEPTFYSGIKNVGEFFLRNNITWMVTRERTPERWFARHPDVSSATISLRPRATDNNLTLYSVSRR